MGIDQYFMFERGMRRTTAEPVTSDVAATLCRDAGQDPDPMREPWFETLEQKRQWRARWRAAVKRQRVLIAEVLCARQDGAEWPAGWSEAKQAQYLAAPSDHARALQALADARTWSSPSRFGPGSGTEGELLYLRAIKPYINFEMAALLRQK